MLLGSVSAGVHWGCERGDSHYRQGAERRTTWPRAPWSPVGCVRMHVHVNLVPPRPPLPSPPPQHDLPLDGQEEELFLRRVGVKRKMWIRCQCWPSTRVMWCTCSHRWPSDTERLVRPRSARVLAALFLTYTGYTCKVNGMNRKLGGKSWISRLINQRNILAISIWILLL